PATDLHGYETDYTNNPSRIRVNLWLVLSSCWARCEPRGSCAASCALCGAETSRCQRLRRASSRSLRVRDLRRRAAQTLCDIPAAVVLTRCPAQSGPSPAWSLDSLCR